MDKFLSCPYPYYNIGKDTGLLPKCCEEAYLWRFDGKKTDKGCDKYIIRFELYRNGITGVKFFLRRFKNAKDRYRMLVKSYDANNVLATCLAVMEEYLNEHPYTSYCFVGSPLIGEGESRTKRFRLYRQIMYRVFSDLNFTHLQIEAKSIYFIINKNMDVKSVIREAERVYKIQTGDSLQ